jgi:hypothetical protein
VAPMNKYSSSEVQVLNVGVALRVYECRTSPFATNI